MVLYTKPLSESDREYVERLWSDYKYLLYKKASGFTGDRELQKDIVQSALLVIIKNISTIRALRCCVLPSYLVLIVRSVSINALKKAGMEAPAPDGDQYDNIPDGGAGTDDAVLRAAEHEDILRLLSGLSESDRLLLEGKYLLELSDAELAKILGISKDSVRMKLTRARRRAEKIFRNEGYDHAL
jgi:RNA polymerase sigma-70 factor (ECF subfamily)